MPELHTFTTGTPRRVVAVSYAAVGTVLRFYFTLTDSLAAVKYPTDSPAQR